MGGAAASGIVGITIIISEGLLLMKSAMLILLLVLILTGYFIYRKKYVIDQKMFDDILAKPEKRGDINSNKE